MIRPAPDTDRASLLAWIADDPALSTLLADAMAELDDDPGHDAAHCLRVALWTLRLGGDQVVPREAVAAALLHDIVNVPKSSPERHLASQKCADVARQRLPALDFDEAATKRICDAIRDHSFSRGAVPDEPLGQALQDADRLEALGVIGLFRCISTGARMGARYFHDADPFAADRPLEDRVYSIDHFYTKLLGLADTMLTAAGRAEAHRRSAWLQGLLAQLSDELAVPRPEGR